MGRRVRGDGSLLDRRDSSYRRARRARRTCHGNAERAPMRRLARGLPTNRPPRLLLLLRGLHSHRRLHVQPAREVAQGFKSYSVAPADRVAQLPALVPRLATRPQRLQPSGSRLHRPRCKRERRCRPCLLAARREYPALGHGPLLAEPQLCQRHRRRQAAVAAVARHGRRRRPLRGGSRRLVVGEQRSRR